MTEEKKDDGGPWWEEGKKYKYIAWPASVEVSFKKQGSEWFCDWGSKLQNVKTGNFNQKFFEEIQK